jgi:hypothetical protein
VRPWSYFIGEDDPKENVEAENVEAENVCPVEKG